jgi:hypothetical protein
MIDDLARQQILGYLDGSLDATERAAFEARLAKDPDLRDALQRQRAIDSALRRSFDPPKVSVAALLKHVEAAPAGTDTPAAPVHTESSVGQVLSRRIWPRRLAIAAALAIAVVGAWQIWSHFQPTQPKYLITAAQYFRNVENQGFKPNWVCENDQQTIDLFNKHFGQPMVIRSADPNVKALGWNYVSLLSPNTLVLLAEAGQEHIMLFIDRSTLDDPALMHQGCSGLNVHRKEVGDLVVYEFSRLPEPQVLDALVPPAS